jgi:hypothetical protein
MIIANTLLSTNINSVSRYSDELRVEPLGLDSRHGKGFLFSKVFRPILGPAQPPIQWVQEATSLGGKAAGA